MKNNFKKIILKIFNTVLSYFYYKGYDNLKDYYILPKSRLNYAENGLYTFHNADFMKDLLFMQSYKLGKATDRGHLLRDTDIHWRIHVLCWAASHAKKLGGDFVDCGVSTGIFPRAVMNYIGFENLDKKYYLLDTFSGLEPKYSSEKEMERNEMMGYNKKEGLYEQVVETFSNYNVEIIQGPIPDTLIKVKTRKVCYLSVDMNCIKPEIDALEFFWDKMVSGGFVILDDYGFEGYIEQKKAHDVFARSKNVEILSLPTCQGMIIKP